MTYGPTIESELIATAFGNQPERWPLPSADTPPQLWLRAVGAGGQGRYASARNDLASLLRSAPGDRLASLAHSTQASFLRQLGWHRLARSWDGRALALAGTDEEAVGDALIGLAADALGVGRLAAAATLLSRAEPIVAQAPQHRLSIRRAWVAAELAMAAGDGAAAVRHAEDAVELAATTVSARHRAKSDVVLAAALCSAGGVDRARTLGAATLELAGRLGLVPLRWAVACLLVDLFEPGSATRSIDELRGLRDESARQVQHWGGAWRPR
ncbi:hypothetical protein [Candidatus Mycobacterium methanotrophicum]|uniref:MalT-like TPR region domain-containing protein n=1 Tax=Candidatus Mycobacterium methanotrophicum TaxID=2943498 RepID=A0ABY4QPL6_9MYCO|nr:hypothetical protein [Candidatus Mycobacterium methanotrophicum]UQX12248.1 hypothetical protein M5I08_08175 [Candidatus Mycobacterium methanotrophicum]